MTVTARIDVHVYASFDEAAPTLNHLEAIRDSTLIVISGQRRLPDWLGELDIDVELKDVVEHGD